MVGSYAWGVACSLILTSTVIKLSFQGFNTIDHFFCEFSSLLSLSCSDTYLNQLLLFIFSTFNEVSTLFIIPVLTRLLLSPSSRCIQPVVAAKPFSPAPPAWPPSASSPAPSSFSTLCPTPHPPGTKSKWHLYFTRWSSPCWIPWSTVWEIKMSRTQSQRSWTLKYFRTKHFSERFCPWYVNKLCLQRLVDKKKFIINDVLICKIESTWYFTQLY